MACAGVARRVLELLGLGVSTQGPLKTPLNQAAFCTTIASSNTWPSCSSHFPLLSPPYLNSSHHLPPFCLLTHFNRFHSNLRSVELSVPPTSHIRHCTTRLDPGCFSPRATSTQALIRSSLPVLLPTNTQHGCACCPTRFQVFEEEGPLGHRTNRVPRTQLHLSLCRQGC